MIRVFYRCLVWLMACSAIVAQNNKWATLQPGLELLEGNFQDQKQLVKFLLLRCDPTRNEVRVIDTFREIGKGNTLAAFSVRAVSKKTGALVSLNAGPTASYTLPVPVGLLLVRGKVVNQANFRAANGGIFCVTGDRVAILNLSSFKSQNCSYAVQRGPLLTRASASANDDKSERYRRTVLAVDKEGKLLILVTSEKTTLALVAAFLYTSRPDLKVQSALNMDGDASSGLLIAAGRSSKPIEIGSVDALVASAIAISSKSGR